MIHFIHVCKDYQVKKVADLASRIWNEHYPPIIGQAQVDYMVEKFQSPDGIIKQIKEGYVYYLINYKTQLVGYFAFKKNSDDLFLSKIYVSKAFRGKGLGKAAFNFIQNAAIKQNCKTISLTVNKYNTNSVLAYERMGFKNVDSIVIDIGNDFVMDDYKMVKKLD